jgi:hypothetical protein
MLLHLAKCPFYWYFVSVKARIRLGDSISTTTAFYKTALLADNGGNTTPLEDW